MVLNPGTNLYHYIVVQMGARSALRFLACAQMVLNPVSELVPVAKKYQVHLISISEVLWHEKSGYAIFECAVSMKLLPTSLPNQSIRFADEFALDLCGGAHFSTWHVRGRSNFRYQKPKKTQWLQLSELCA